MALSIDVGVAQQFAVTFFKNFENINVMRTRGVVSGMRASGVAIAGLSIILRCNAFDDKGTYLGGFIPLCRTNMMVVVGRPGLCGARLSHSSVDLRDIRTSLRLVLATGRHANEGEESL